MNKKQIILIMTDSQRWDMVNCYKKTGLHTPHLDALAERGMRFEHASCVSPVCQPARSALFFGQYPHACGSWTNSYGLSDNSHSIGERLQKHGIHTAYIGKWHLDGGDYFGLGVCPKGWDQAYWYDMRNYLDEMTNQERQDSRNTDLMNERDFTRESTFAHRCSNRGIDFLTKHCGEDFFLTVSYDEPHDPFICPQPYAGMYADYEFPKSPNIFDTLKNKPDYQRVWAGNRLSANKESLKIRHQFYFGCNSFVDDEIGRLLTTAYKAVPNALIIYTSDHGEFLESHSLTGKGPAAYEEITRIPLIISGSFNGKTVPAGAVNKNPVSHLNIAPSILALMEVPQPCVFDGKSLLPELDAAPKRVNNHVFMEFGRYETDHDGFGGFQPLRAVFDGRYKLSINLLSGDELYDLQDDPHELTNLIFSPKTEEKRNELHDALLAEMNRSRDPFRGYWWERREWRKDASEASWDYTLMTRQREDAEFEQRQLDYSTGLPVRDLVRKKRVLK